MTRRQDSQSVWIDGRIVPADEATVSFFCHEIHYGTGVFEGIRCYDTEEGPAVFRLPEHLERLRKSAHSYELEYAHSDADLTQAILDLIRSHGLKECYIRPVVLLGEGKLAVMPEDNEVMTCIAIWSWGRYLGPEALSRGVTTTIVRKTRKYPAVCLDPTVKAVGHYLNSVRATREAKARGFDEGIMLNTEGRVAEGPGENVFLVKDGVVITNPVEECILEGVTRASVLELAQAAGIPTRVEPITVEALMDADEVFFSGTAAEVTPIRSIDEKVVGSGERGPVTTRLQDDYLAAVHGRLPRFERWLTRVEA